MARDLYEAAHERLTSALGQFDRGQLEADELIDEAYLMLRFAVLSEPEPFDDDASLLGAADSGIRSRLAGLPGDHSWQPRWDSALRRLKDIARLHDEAHSRTVEWEGADASAAGDASVAAAGIAVVLAHAEPWVGSIERHARAGARIYGVDLLRDIAVLICAAPPDASDASRRWLPWVLGELAAHAWSASHDRRTGSARRALLELVAVPDASRAARLRLPLHLLTRPERQWLDRLPTSTAADVPTGWLPSTLAVSSSPAELVCLELLESAGLASCVPAPGVVSSLATTGQDAHVGHVAAALAAYDVGSLGRLVLGQAGAAPGLPAWVLAVVDELAAWAASTDPALTTRPRPSADSTAEAARRELLTLAGVDALTALALPRLPLWRLDTRDRWALEELLELREELFREEWVDDADVAVTEALRLTHLRDLAAGTGKLA